MSYSQTQWLLIFYFYCLAGWIWETFYVSVSQRQWVNRGFLRGPWLPIYGSGAIIILFATLPVSHSNVLIFLIGMVSATILEYVTGVVMERLFQMRYWDYSDRPLNVNGYICFPASVAWGFFSLFLVRILHPPIDSLVLSLSGWAVDILSVALTVLFTVDVTKSVQNALDLKELMEKLTENNQTLERLESRFDALTEKVSEGSEQFRERIQELELSRVERREAMQQHWEAKTQSRKSYLLERLGEHRDRKSRILSTVAEKTDAALAEIRVQLQFAKSEQDRERLENICSALSDLRLSIHNAETEVAARRNRDYQRAVSILERNPSAISRRYPKAFSELSGLKRPRHTGKRKEKHKKKDHDV